MHDLIQIKAVVEDSYNKIDISEKTRRTPYPDAIKIYSYIANQATQYTTKEIADLVNRDHSTIVIAIQRCEDLMQIDRDFRNKVKYCIKICANMLNIDTATYKERIDLVFSKLSNEQQKNLYVLSQKMYNKNLQLENQLQYVE